LRRATAAPPLRQPPPSSATSRARAASQWATAASGSALRTWCFHPLAAQGGARELFQSAIPVCLLTGQLCRCTRVMAGRALRMPCFLVCVHVDREACIDCVVQTSTGGNSKSCQGPFITPCNTTQSHPPRNDLMPCPRQVALPW
jgi:hypothetical protein